MKSNYQLFGFHFDSLREVAEKLRDVLSVSWRLHESSFSGEYYRSGKRGEEEFVLQNNFDENENEWQEPEFEEYPILLYVNETKRSTEIKKSIDKEFGPKAKLLRTENL